MNILIAQDDKSTSQSLEATLTKWGHEVVTVPDGQAALRALQTEAAPRLAVLGSTLPGMDAFQICRTVRKRPEGPYVYFIVMVAKGREQDIIEGIRAGADDFLLTPVNPSLPGSTCAWGTCSAPMRRSATRRRTTL